MSYLKYLIVGAASLAVWVYGVAAFDRNAPQAQLGQWFCIVFGGLGVGGSGVAAVIEFAVGGRTCDESHDDEPWGMP